MHVHPTKCICYAINCQYLYIMKSYGICFATVVEGSFPLLGHPSFNAIHFQGSDGASKHVVAWMTTRWSWVHAQMLRCS